MQDLIFDKNIARYRQEEIEEGAKIASDIFKANMEPAFIKGAMHILKKILHLPQQFAKTKEAKETADNMVAKDLKEFHSRFVRLFVE